MVRTVLDNIIIGRVSLGATPSALAQWTQREAIEWLASGTSTTNWKHSELLSILGEDGYPLLNEKHLRERTKWRTRRLITGAQLKARAAASP